LKDKIIFSVAVLALVAAILGLFTTEGSMTRVYDCGMAEWHPDIPPAVKEECRKRALEYWREQQEQNDKGRLTI
jgi:hypothetical protein